MQKKQENSMYKPFLNILSALFAALVVTVAIGAPFYYYSYMKPEAIEVHALRDTVDSLQLVISSMQQVDTLTLNISEINAKNIESIEQEQAIVKRRVTDLEWWAKDVDADLDSYD